MLYLVRKAFRRGLIAPGDANALRRQESLLILLNLSVLAALFLVHILFRSLLGMPSRLIVLIFTGRFLMQLAELLWLQGLKKPLSSEAVYVYSRLSVWLHVAFASAVSVLSGAEDSHYAVLMVLPTIAAAFRFSLLGITAVVAAASCSTFLEVWVNYSGGVLVQPAEYFEAATVTLIYLLVALVVWLLVSRLRREGTRLKQSLEELKQTRDRLVAEEKLAAVGRLASAVAHEIRNPVAMITSAITSVKQSGFEPNVQVEMYELVAGEAARLEKLTNDLLTYFREKAPEKRVTSSATTLEYVASIIRPRAADKEIEVTVDCPEDVQALFDPFQMYQALLNLAVNALDATSVGGVVTLGAARGPGGQITLYVANTGDPIPGSIRSNIFEPFFTTKPRGTGLGLAIARKIGRAHGGELTLSANELGRVRFDVRLPARMPAEPPATEVMHGADSGRRR